MWDCTFKTKMLAVLTISFANRDKRATQLIVQGRGAMLSPEEVNFIVLAASLTCRVIAL